MLRTAAAKHLITGLMLVGASSWCGTSEASVCAEWHWEAVAVTVDIEPDPACVDVELVGALHDCNVPSVEFVNSCSEAIEFVETPANTCPGSDCPTIQPGDSQSFAISSSDFIDEVAQHYVVTLGADQIDIEVSFQTESLTDDEADSGCAIAPGSRPAGDGLSLALLGALLALARVRRR